MPKSTWGGLQILFVSIVCLMQTNLAQTQCWAAVPTESQLRAALGKANFLSGNAKFSITTDPKQSDGLIITMFRQQDATDKDCKIDALLIAKTVMDLGGSDVTKVTVYFYSLTMSNYKSVTIRTTDVKAFSGGAVDKDELLKTLDLTSGKVADDPKRLERFLQEKRGGPSDVVGAIVGDTLQIKSSSIDISSEANAKIDALQLALAAVPVLRAGIQKVTVSYDSYAGGQSESARSITFTVDQLKSISQQVETILAPVVVTTGADAKKQGSEKK